MPFCPKCGMQNNGKFCTNCGTPITQASAPTQKPQAASVPPQQQFVPAQPKQQAYNQPQQPVAQMPNLSAQKPKKNILPWIIVAAVSVIAIVAVVLLLLKQNKAPTPTEASQVTPPTESLAAPTAAPDTQALETASPDTTTAETEPVVPQTTALFSTSNHLVDGKVFFSDSNGIFYFEGGTRYDVYPEDNWNFATNGNTLYTVSNGTNVIEVDIATGSARVLFSVNAYNAIICGATENELYIGTQESEEDWFGYTVAAYDMSGNALRTYGSNLDPEMQDGVLILRDFRSDVSPMSVQIIDTQSQQVLYSTADDLCSWGVQVIDGKVYSLEVPYAFYESAYIMELVCYDAGSSKILMSCPVDENQYSIAGSLGNGVAVICDWSDSSAHYYKVTDGSELIAPFETTSLAYDTDGRAYCTTDDKLYRQNDNGQFVEVASLEGEYSYVMQVVGDYVYYNREGMDICLCYAPVN